MPVNTTHKDYQRMLSKWVMCRDVAAGQGAVHAAGEAYLPKLKEQKKEDYDSYKLRATFYGATWRTISGLVGMLFRKPPKIETPESIASLLEDIDGAGEPFQLFVQDICEQALTVGRIGLLVDCPPVVAVTGRAATLADANAQGIRPMLQLYRAEAIINWKTGKVGNRKALVQLVLEEVETVPTDEFTGKDEKRWRVLDLSNGVYRQRLYKRKGGIVPVPGTADEFEQIGGDIIPLMGGMPLTYIPFTIIGTDDLTTDVDDPPLIDLTYMNLAHYRTTADYAHGCHFSGLPTLFLAGIKLENPGDKIYIGSEAAIVTSNENAKATFVEVSSEFKALVAKMEREEQQMAVLGARMLEPQRRGVEAPETAAIHRKGEEALLSSIAQAISLGVTQGLKTLVEWAGADPSAVKFDLNRDFYPAPMTPAMLTALLAGWQQGAPGLSDQGLFDQLKMGEIVPQDATLEDEQARISARQLQLAQQQAAFNQPPQVDAQGNLIQGA